MSKYLFSIISLVLSYLLFTSCANVSPISGGPKDTIPPIRLITIPLDKSINYTKKTIFMEFDERIKISKIKEQLIITPLIESDYEYIIKKNTIKLTFEEQFIDSTTYTLNFRESIQDITESSPTKDNKFTFSTGSFIDSMSITGYVKELLTYDTLENIMIGLYKAEDTITIFNGSPYYFTELDEEGKYIIENIKIGKYLLYAFQDENKNLTLETNDESYGFVRDTIYLDSGLVTKNIDLINLDLTDFKIKSTLPSGQYFDINLNKYIADYSVTPLNIEHQLYTSRAKENNSIRFYNNFTDLDSIQVSFTAIDSINSELADTVFVKFSKSKRKKDKFSIKLTPEKNTQIEKLLNVEIEFNKPIKLINSDSIFVRFDTTIITYVHDSLFVWNQLKDKISFQIEIDKTMADTILSRKIKRNQILKDSTKNAAKESTVKKQMPKNKIDNKPTINTGLQLYFGIGSFYSADQDTSKSMGYNYKFIVPEDHGIQHININTQYDHFFLQLLDKNFEIVREISNQKSITFKNILPGSYKIRVLIDIDNDGIWRPGNMKKRIEPEPVYIYPETLVIRADWQTSLDLTF